MPYLKVLLFFHVGLCPLNYMLSSVFLLVVVECLRREEHFIIVSRFS
jgi:hypothetical protein